MEEMLININSETGRLHEKTRNSIQRMILMKMMKRLGLSQEDKESPMKCYEKCGVDMTNILNDRALNNKIEELAAIKDTGIEQAADFIISLLPDYSERQDIAA